MEATVPVAVCVMLSTPETTGLSQVAPSGLTNPVETLLYSTILWIQPVKQMWQRYRRASQMPQGAGCKTYLSWKRYPHIGQHTIECCAMLVYTWHRWIWCHGAVDSLCHTY
ncbi:hypothetical protein VFPPC_17854 [Pochonia chlamydosporia 170]|uniref:Uncharacterized protein n=1 Tax=Pochonia chlamydosporia 170 TaxID=1380566 RepID=A0A219AQ84_METCM|nr:hypothetical protein VFPPC_17854 [Pochonia chlamydosporia 170]OWT42953.1 hypothetical protein VFPPC_17854 [Pochonia chlamydosporia 170]